LLTFRKATGAALSIIKKRQRWFNILLARGKLWLDGRRPWWFRDNFRRFLCSTTSGTPKEFENHCV